MSAPSTVRRRILAALALTVATSTAMMTAGTGMTQAAPRPDSQAAGQSHSHGDQAAHKSVRDTVPIQLLSFNDFHGNLEAPGGSSGKIVTGHELAPGATKPSDVTTDAGGVEYLASHLREARRGHPNSLTVAAGDIVGASPLLSAAFHDEPSIEAMNELGLDVTSVGNHEFDEGYKELQRLQNGGCLPDGDGANNQNSCATGDFAGADFDILAANVKVKATGKTILAPYAVKKMHGAKIGFIGMTLKDTPNIVTQSGVAGLEFTDEVQTANALVPVLKKQGVKAIVVLVHQGGTPAVEKWTGPDGKTYDVNATYDYACGKGGTLTPDSAILPIAANLSPQIDMVVSGHTHQPYVCNVPDPAGQPRLVTSASSFGRLYTETNLTYSRRTQDIVRSSVTGNNMVVSRDVPKAPDLTKLVDTYKTLVAPIANKVLGQITTDITRKQSSAGESALGDLIADAQLADASVVTGGKTPVVAFMNPGGIRADLSYAAKGDEGDGVVTYEEAFTVQPFNNYLVSMDLTGADIYALLDQQWSGKNTATYPKVLQISKGFTYSWTDAGDTRQVVPGGVKINGTAVVADQTYRIVANNFLSDGGDGFPAFTNGKDKYFGGLDIDGFAKYLPTVSPYTPAPLNRITGP